MGRPDYGGTGAPSDAGYISIYSNIFSFAALKADGSIHVWGFAAYGGSNAPTGSGYVSIASTRFAFAAIKADGSINAWGLDGQGADGEPTDAGYVSLASSWDDFAARKADGSIASWGNNGSIGPIDSGYVRVVPNNTSFAALKSDGSIVTWGTPLFGGAGGPTDNGYQSVAANHGAFAALKSDGSISSWGHSTYLGSGAPSDNGYTSIATNTYAFAALKADGSISAWGNTSNGGTGAPTDSGYIAIASTATAFAALKADGSVTAWGSASGTAGAPSTGVASLAGRTGNDNTDCRTSNNAIPRMAGTPATTINQGAIFSFTPTVIDSAGDSHSFGIINKPSWATFNAISGQLLGTPANVDVGISSAISISATDAGGRSASLRAFDIVVNDVNDAPVLDNAISNQSTLEDAAFSFTVPTNTFSDQDTADTLTYSVTSTLPAWLTFNPVSRLFSGTPSNDDVGNVSIVLQASDGSLSASDSFDITVNNSNDAPLLANALSDQTVAEDSIFNFVVPANTFSDPDIGDSLSYSVSSVLPGWLSSDPTSRTFLGAPGNAEVGTVSVTVQVSDGSANTDDTFELTVTNTNDAPILLNAIPDQSTIEDIVFSFTVPANTFQDIDENDTLSYAVVTTLPGWLSFNPATRVFSGTAINADVGTVSITLQLSDGSLDISDTFDLVVINSNDPPELANPLADQSADEDTVFSFTVPVSTFSDPDTGDALSLSISSVLPSWLSFDGVSNVLLGTPSNADVGTFAVTVQASDGSLSANDSFDLTINNSNDAPQLQNAIPDQYASDGDLFSFSVPATTFIDIDAADTLIYSVTTTLPTWLSFDPSSNNFSGTPATSDTGAISITVQASDGVLAASDSFTLVVDDAISTLINQRRSTYPY